MDKNWNNIFVFSGFLLYVIIYGLCPIYISKKCPGLILRRSNGEKQSIWYYILLVPVMYFQIEYFVQDKDTEKINELVLSRYYISGWLIVSVVTIFLLIFMI